MPVIVPPEVMDLFDEPALGHVSYIAPGGQVVSFPMWVDFDGSHLLVSSPVGSKKGAALRKNPHVGISIVSPKTQWHWLSASGRVVEFRPDEGLAFIDKMARKYTGQDYTRRIPREIFVIELDRATKGWG